MKKEFIFFRWLLIPPSIVYGIIVYIRNFLFDHNILRSTEFSIPIISVGNITVGGTGKTPHVEYLIALLKNDFKIATLSRGYKRKSKGYVLANGNATSHIIGDEPMQIKNKFPDVLVAVDNKRVHGVQKLLSSSEGKTLDTILLDDAYQHRHIKPGLSILLVDYNRPLCKDHILPYGRLRESAHEKDRANIVIVSKSPESLRPIDRRIVVKELNLLPCQSLYFSTLQYGNLQPVFPKEAIPIVDEEWSEKNFTVLLVSGIANPAPLREYLNQLYGHVEEIVFSDHHIFSRKDVRKIAEKFKKLDATDKIIVTTEKDLTRLKPLGIEDELLHRHLFYIPLQIRFLNNDKARFNKQILSYVKKNTRSLALQKCEESI